MTILKVRLITAFSCRIDGAKNVTVINGSRKKGSWVVAGKPTRLEVEFRELVEHVDITFERAGFNGKVSMEGLGLKFADIVTVLPVLEQFTYRFKPPTPVKGKLLFQTLGGAGHLAIVNISGFTAQELKK